MKNTNWGRRGRWWLKNPLCRTWLENHLGRKYSHCKGQKNPINPSGLGTREFTIPPSSSVCSEHSLSCWQASDLISIPNPSLLPESKHGFDLYIDPSNHHVHTLHHAPWPCTHMHKMLNNALRALIWSTSTVTCRALTRDFKCANSTYWGCNCTRQLNSC